MKDKIKDYSEDWFTVEQYNRLYDTIVHPISALSIWEKRDLPKLDPPHS